MNWLVCGTAHGGLGPKLQSFCIFPSNRGNLSKNSSINNILNVHPLSKSDPSSLRSILISNSALRKSFNLLGSDTEILKVIIQLVLSKLDKEIVFSLLTWEQCSVILSRFFNSRKKHGQPSTGGCVICNYSSCKDINHSLETCPSYLS